MDRDDYPDVANLVDDYYSHPGYYDDSSQRNYYDGDTYDNNIYDDTYRGFHHDYPTYSGLDAGGYGRIQPSPQISRAEAIQAANGRRSGPIPGKAGGMRKVQYKNYQCREYKPVCFLGINVMSSIFWAYLLIILIVAVVLVILWFNSSYPGTMTPPDDAPSGSFFLASFIVSIITFIWAGYFGYIRSAPDYRHQNLLNLAFALNVIVGLFWAVVFFYLSQPADAFWLITILVLLNIFWIFLIWNIDRISAYFLLIHLVFVAYIAYVNYNFAILNSL